MESTVYRKADRNENQALVFYNQIVMNMTKE